mmetsp:Transcript_10970/g.33656  ORF Transcript_10970/g.33656 Transcript_10970/m.33656 type:complete len:266 (+) Transcript_10970:188-985(+)
MGVMKELSLVHVERRNGYAVILMNRPPVNAMSLELWRDLLEALEMMEADDSVQGVIFASALKRDVFTAGIDLHELSRETTTEDRLQSFWVTMTKFLARVYRSNLVTIAAIRGQCPAGGCVLALACDYRIMSDGGAIGLNESRLGIPVPAYWAELFCSIAGKARGEWMLISGNMYKASEALEAGIVNEVVSSDQVLSKAEKTMKTTLQVAYSGRIGAIKTKNALRNDFASRWEANAFAEAKQTWNITGENSVRTTLNKYMKMLSKL